MAKTYDVYGTKDNWLYSKGVTRDFGVNRLVKLDKNGDTVLASVQPLSVLTADAIEHGYVKKVGVIVNDEE